MSILYIKQLKFSCYLIIKMSRSCSTWCHGRFSSKSEFFHDITLYLYEYFHCKYFRQVHMMNLLSIFFNWSVNDFDNMMKCVDIWIKYWKIDSKNKWIHKNYVTCQKPFNPRANQLIGLIYRYDSHFIFEFKS